MFSALGKAFAQAFDPAFRRVLLVSLAGAVGIFLLLWALAWFGLAWTGEALSGWIAAREPGSFWVRAFEWIFGAAGLIAVLVASFFLFPSVMATVISLFLEDIATAVEDRYYPDLAPPRNPSIREAILTSAAFTGVTLALNLLALPLYLLLLFVPPLNLFVFYMLNGYLLGREYFEIVAARRAGVQGVKRLRRAYRGRLFVAGVIIAFFLTLPLVNLVMPIIATAFMLHVFEVLRRRERAPA